MFHGQQFHLERPSRIFEKGDLKYVILNLLKDKPSHGYEIIRAMEEHLHGFYTPSAGSVYPTLQMLDDMGYVSSSERDGKKVYTITPEGRKFLTEQKEVIEKIQCQVKDWWGPRDTSEFHETISELKKLGGTVGQKACRLKPENWKAIKSIIAKARKDVEKILELSEK
jgi:DNA-binding PadR family transcriptional regulator